jgi:hypothetical protein
MLPSEENKEFGLRASSHSAIPSTEMRASQQELLSLSQDQCLGGLASHALRQPVCIFQDPDCHGCGSAVTFLGCSSFFFIPLHFLENEQRTTRKQKLSV